MLSPASDWSEFTRNRTKNLEAGTSATGLRSFGSLMRPLVTSAPVRLSESKVKTSGANPTVSIVNNVHGFFFDLGGLRAGGTVANSIAALLPGMVTFAGVPPTVTLKEQLALLPCTSVAVQVTVVVPNGK